MQLRKVCNHPDLFEVRPIVTSFSMQRSVASSFEPAELLVWRYGKAAEASSVIRTCEATVVVVSSCQGLTSVNVINCLMQLRKVCNHPDLFEVRPIVTSFSMQRSVASSTGKRRRHRASSGPAKPPSSSSPPAKA
jgi:SNF2 family DNA or RNA helicase